MARCQDQKEIICFQRYRRVGTKATCYELGLEMWWQEKHLFNTTTGTAIDTLLNQPTRGPRGQGAPRPELLFEVILDISVQKSI